MSIINKPDDPRRTDSPSYGRRAIAEAAKADEKHSDIDRMNGSTERDPIWLATHWAACLDLPSGDFVKRDLLFVAEEIRRRDARIAILTNIDPDPRDAMLAKARDALAGAKAEWDRLTRYGSPLAKQANENFRRVDEAIAAIDAATKGGA